MFGEARTRRFKSSIPTNDFLQGLGLGDSLNPEPLQIAVRLFSKPRLKACAVLLGYSAPLVVGHNAINVVVKATSQAAAGREDANSGRNSQNIFRRIERTSRLNGSSSTPDMSCITRGARLLS
jgi:hypothetical protein